MSLDKILSEYSEIKVFDDWNGHQMTILKEVSERYAQQRVNEVQEHIESRISQLNDQLDNPEVLDQKRIEVKLESYNEFLSILKLKNDGK